MKRHALQMAWQQRSARERRLLVLATALLGAALLWQWGLAPAVTTWRTASQQQAHLDQQTQRMLELQAQARELKTPARMPRQEAIAWLESSARSLLGSDTRLSVQGDVLRVSLTATSSSGLAQWITLAREKALTLPQSAQLTQVLATKSTPTTPAPTSAKDKAEVLWRGELTLRLP